MTGSRIFLRNDDVVVLSDNFLRFHSIALEHQVPVVYGVIPDRVDKEMRLFLLRQKKKAPRLVDIVQHGFRHVNYARSGEEKYEFGASRSYEEQYNDITGGLELMRDSFGHSFTPAFVPPFHGFDQNTLAVLEVLGVPLFSAGKRAGFKGDGCRDFPAEHALNAYAPSGMPRSFGPGDALKVVVRCAASQGTAGLVFHHEALSSVESVHALTLAFGLLARLRAEGRIKIVLFSDILRGLNSGSGVDRPKGPSGRRPGYGGGGLCG